MRRFVVLAFALAALVAVIAAPMVAGDGAKRFRATLDGYAETPSTISTAGRGSFTASIEGESIRFRLRFENLSGPPTQSHIHFGAPSTTGGISVWLCGSATNNHPSQPATCPTSTSGEVNAVVGPASVIGPTGQGIAPGEWAELVRAMRAGVTYVNVHTTLHPPGEIRGRLVRSDDD